MLYHGEAIRLIEQDNGIVELCFELEKDSVNKFNQTTLEDLDKAISVLESHEPLTGVLVTSAKDVFIVGADISEFRPIFAKGAEIITTYLTSVNATFNRFEDLAVPTVVAINGYALGGGLEFCLACDYRLMSRKAKIGLPETRLGIFPGWGGTVRMPRLAGVDVAVEWIASGKEYSAETAAIAGVIDGVTEPDRLRDAAVNVLNRAIAGNLDFAARRAQKTSPLKINATEGLLSFESTKAFVAGQAGRHYPAPVAAIKAMQESAGLSRNEALKIETGRFVKMAVTPVATALVGLFLSDQLLSKKAKKLVKGLDKTVSSAAVLGAGIMGGGIAYQSAYKGVPVLMKDIAQQGLDLGMSEAAKLLKKRVERGRMTPLAMAETLTRIRPSLDYNGIEQVDIVVEAVVENIAVKHSVLTEVEGKISADAILCSNTSTISIDSLAKPLKRPQNFCGMHFFNPVHAMPLVEVIRGKQTSEQAIAMTVAYALAMGKKPVIVNDCPGFLVNRVLFPYFAGFSMLVRDGADYQHIDKVMESWGWPMGPAYLMDVVGIDTGVHAEKVMAEGFPERMGKTFTAASDILFDAKRYGQKNHRGFYNYVPDKKGKPQKQPAVEVADLLSTHVAAAKEFSDDDIVMRMMLPMVTEMARCLEEGVVASAAEADMALVYGLGFPPFRGGIFRWLDETGVAKVCEVAKSYGELGPLYQPTDDMLTRASSQQPYYS